MTSRAQTFIALGIVLTASGCGSNPTDANPAPVPASPQATVEVDAGAISNAGTERDDAAPSPNAPDAMPPPSCTADASLCDYVPPPREVRASQDRPDAVRVTWRAPNRATPDGYIVLRDGSPIAEVPASATEYVDSTAAPPTLGAPSQFTATSARTDGVALAWAAVSGVPGAPSAYGVRARYGSRESDRAGDALGFRAGGTVTYQVSRDGQWVMDANQPALLDADAALVSLSGGNAIATPEVWRSANALKVTQEPTATPHPHEYRVRAILPGLVGAESSPVVGARAAGELEFQWERYDSSGGYQDLVGVTGRVWVDATAPLGTGSTYQVRVRGDGTSALTIASSATGILTALATLAHSGGLDYPLALTASGMPEYRPEMGASAILGAPFDKVAGSTSGGCGIRRVDQRIQCWGQPWYYSQKFTGKAHDISLSGGGLCVVREDDRTAFCDGLFPFDFGSDTFESIVAAQTTACGLRLDGTIECKHNPAFANYVDALANPPSGAFARLWTGGDAACALRGDGSFACWGNPDAVASIPSSERFLQMDVAYWRTCGVRPDHSLACWTKEGLFALPRDLAAPNKFVDVASSFLAELCAIRDDGRMRCMHAPLPPQESMKSVAVGPNRSCGIRADGSPTCWHGPTYDEQFQTVAGIKFRKISVGPAHVCALRESGTVDCFGDPSVAVPSELTNATFSAIDTYPTTQGGPMGACGLLTTGDVRCWGPSAPAPLTGPFVDFSASDHEVLGLGADGRIYDATGPVNWTSPTTTYRALSAASFDALLRADGHVEIYNAFGSFHDLQQLTAGRYVSVVTGGGTAALALREDGRIDDLGNNSSLDRWPADRFVSIGARDPHYCAVRADGHALCSRFYWTYGSVP